MHTPQEGKALTTAYLSAAIVVLGPTLAYVREWYADGLGRAGVPRRLDGLTVHGVDMLTWGPDGRLTEFTVMVRARSRASQRSWMGELMAAELPPATDRRPSVRRRSPAPRALRRPLGASAVSTHPTSDP